MKIDGSMIERVSTLARLSLTEQEKEEFTRQLSDIVSYVEKINELDTGSIEPADHIVPMRNVFRSDTPGASIGREEIERIAPDFDRGHIIVPPAIEGNE
jgi:aspartyl-tRNA(Asn)/glutamyl-tRNA(Gln) amidotransferase subunit C